MAIKILKKIFVAIFLFSVLLHALVFLENVVIPRIINPSHCKNEDLLSSLLDGCSPVNVYLKPIFYYGVLYCRLTDGILERTPDGYSCLLRPIPLLIDPDSPFYSPPPPESNFEKIISNFEKIIEKAKWTTWHFLDIFFFISFLPVSAIVFITLMFANCVTRPIPKKGAWVALILFGYVYGGLIYYFIGRKRLRVSTTSR